MSGGNSMAGGKMAGGTAGTNCPPVTH
jgi:hypothetical protein